MSQEKSVGKTTLKVLLWIVVSIIVVALIIYLFLRLVVGIDIFTLINRLNQLNQPINVETIVTYPYERNDAMVNQINTILQEGSGKSNIVTIDTAGEITINSEELESAVFDRSLKLTDKQTACIISASFNEFLEGQEGSSLFLEDLEFLQLKFSDLVEQSGSFKSVNINSIVKVSLKTFKDSLVSFPLTMIKGYIPEFLYVETTVKVIKKVGFNYEFEAISIKINNMNEADSENLINCINPIISLGTPEDCCTTIGGTIVDIIIGNKESTGFGKSLLNASDFKFVKNGETIYYVVEFI